MPVQSRFVEHLAEDVFQQLLEFLRTHKLYVGAFIAGIITTYEGYSTGDLSKAMMMARVLMDFVLFIERANKSVNIAELGLSLFEWVMERIDQLATRTYRVIEGLFPKEETPTTRGFFPPAGAHPQPADATIHLSGTEATGGTAITTTHIKLLLGLFMGLSSLFGKGQYLLKSLKDTAVTIRSSSDIIATIRDSLGLVKAEHEAQYDRLIQAERTLETLRGLPFVERFKRAAEVKAGLEELRAANLEAARAKDPALTAMVHRLNRLDGHMAQDLARLQQIEKNIKNIRPAPVCLHFTGPPGHGKTDYVFKDLIPDICEEANLGAPTDNIFRANLGTKHWPQYTGQAFLVQDEAFAMGLDDETLPFFNMLTTESPITVDGADISEKQQYIQHRFFITMSNKQSLTALNDTRREMVNAINSRLDANLYYVHWPELGPKGLQGIDRDKAPDALNVEHQRRNLCFHKINTKTPIPSGNECPGGKHTRMYPKLTHVDLLREATARYKHNLAKHEAAVKKAFERETAASTEHFSQLKTNRVYLLSGFPDSGKTTMMNRVRAEITSRGLLSDYDPVFLDDALFSDESAEQFLQTYNGLNPNQDIFLTTNREITPTWTNSLFGSRSFKTVLPPRIATRLPIRGAVYAQGGADPGWVSPTVPGLAIQMLPDLRARVLGEAKLMGHDELTKLIVDDYCKDRVLKFQARLPGAPVAIKIGHWNQPLHVIRGTAGAYAAQEMLRSYQRANSNPDFIALTHLMGPKLLAHGYPAVDLEFSNPEACAQFRDGSWTFSAPLVTRAQLAAGHAPNDPIWDFLKRVHAGETKAEHVPFNGASYLNVMWQRFLRTGVGAVLLKIIGYFAVISVGAALASWVSLKIAQAAFPEPPRAGPMPGAVSVPPEPGRAPGADFELSQDPTFRDYVKEQAKHLMMSEEEYEEYLRKKEARRKAEAARVDHYGLSNEEQVRAAIQVLTAAPKPMAAAVAKRVRRNATIVVSEHTIVFGYMLYGNVGVTVCHVAPDATHVDVAVRASNSDNHLSYSARIIRKDHARDLMLFRIEEASFPPYPDIRKFHITEKNLRNVRAASWLRPYGDGQTHTIGGALSMARENEVPRLRCRNFQRDIALLNIGCRDTYAKHGDCGSVLFANDPRLQDANIIGQFSFKETDGVHLGFTILTQEVIADLLTVHQGSELPVFETVDHLGFTMEKHVAELFVDPNPRTIDPFKPNDRITYLGTFPKVLVGMSRPTELHKLPHQPRDPPNKIPALQPPEYFPSETVKLWSLSPHGKPNRVFTQFSKKVLHDVPADSASLSASAEWGEWLDDILGEELRPLSMFEALNGVEVGDPLEAIGGLDLSTSAGFIQKKLFHNSKKSDVITMDDFGIKKWNTANPGAMYCIAHLRTIQASRGEVIPVVPVISSQKDELVDAKKVKHAGKVRMISSVGLEQLIANKMYLGAPVGAVQNHLFEVHHTSGFNPLQDFDTMYSHLQRHPNLMTWDYSSWDNRMPLHIQEGFLDAMSGIFDRRYPEPARSIAKALLRTLRDRIDIYERHAMAIRGSLASGIYWTNFMNSGVNDVLIITVVKNLVHKALGHMPSLAEIHANMEWFTHGDDVIASVSNAWSGFIDYFRIKEAMASQGLTITPGNKNGEERAFEPLADTSFLARAPVHFMGRLVGRLRMESIEQRFSYGLALDEEYLVANFCDALGEAVLHGKLEYERLRATGAKTLRSLGYAWNVLPTYGESYRRLAGMVGETPVSGGSRPLQLLSEGYALLKQSSTMTSKSTDSPTPTAHCSLGVTTPGGRVLPPPPDFTCKNGKRWPLTREAIDAHKAECDCRAKLDESAGIRQLVSNLLMEDAILEHIADVDEHRAQVNRAMRALFGRSVPAHDLTKYGTQMYGYTLRWFLNLDHWLYRDAVKEHYELETHHPEHWRAKGLPMPRADIEEHMADTVACLRGREGKPCYGKSIKETLDWCHDNIWTKDSYTQRDIQPTVLEIYEELNTARPDQGLGTSIPCPTCGILCKSGLKLLRHARGAHKVTDCPLCGKLLPWHTGRCEAYLVFVCSEGDFTSEEEGKVRNHAQNAHPQPAECLRVYKRGYERTYGDGEDGFVPSFGETEHCSLRVADSAVASTIPLLMGTGGTGELISGPDTIGPIAALLPGFTDNAWELMYKFQYVERITIAPTATEGTVLWSAVYGNSALERAGPFINQMKDLHRYFHGKIEFMFEVYGAATNIGGLTIGWAPAIGNTIPTSIAELKSYGKWQDFAFNVTTTGNFSLGYADDTIRAVETDQNIPSAIVIMVQEPVFNAIGTGETQLAIHIHARLAPDAGFTFPNFIGDGQTVLQRSLDESRATLADFTSASAVRIHLDGNIVPSPRMNAQRASVEAETFSALSTGLPDWDGLNGNSVLPNGTGCQTYQILEDEANNDEHAIVWGRITNYPFATLTAELRKDGFAPTPEAFVIQGDYEDALLSISAAKTCTAIWKDGSLGFRATFEAQSPQAANNVINDQFRDQIQYYASSFAVRDINNYVSLPDSRRRLTFVDAGFPLMGINPSITQKLPLQGTTALERAICHWAARNHGGKNVVIAVSASGSPWFEMVYDRSLDCLVINFPDLNYGYVQANANDVTLTIVGSSSVDTLPTRARNSNWITQSVSLDIGGVPNATQLANLKDYNGSRTEHCAGALSMGALAAMLGTSVLNQGSDNIATGVRQRRQNEWQSQENALTRKTIAALTAAQEKAKMNRLVANNANLLSTANSQMYGDPVANWDTASTSTNATIADIDDSATVRNYDAAYRPTPDGDMEKVFEPTRIRPETSETANQLTPDQTRFTRTRQDGFRAGMPVRNTKTGEMPSRPQDVQAILGDEATGHAPSPIELPTDAEARAVQRSSEPNGGAGDTGDSTSGSASSAATEKTMYYSVPGSTSV